MKGLAVENTGRFYGLDIACRCSTHITIDWVESCASQDLASVRTPIVSASITAINQSHWLVDLNRVMPNCEKGEARITGSRISSIYSDSAEQSTSPSTNSGQMNLWQMPHSTFLNGFDLHTVDRLWTGNLLIHCWSRILLLKHYNYRRFASFYTCIACQACCFTSLPSSLWFRESHR